MSRWKWLLVLALAGSSLAQVPSEPGQPEAAPEPAPRDAARIAALEARAFDAIDARDYPAAEEALRELVEIDAGNFVPAYNLACVRALQGEADDAMAHLELAISRGFVDLRQMERDPNLDGVRAHPRYRLLVERWSGVVGAHLDANLEIVARTFRGGRYESVRDEALRLAYVSAFDPTSFEQAREEIRRVSDWAIASVFSDLAEPGPDAWVVVVLPTRKDFQRWAVGTFGLDAASDFRQIGGSYDHDAKRLVAQDLGATLRHEFMHVLHWRSNARAGRLHAIWVQEGLCSLVEDCDHDVRGQLVPVASWRTNIVKRLLDSGRLPTIRELTAMSRAQFQGSRPLARYAHARAVFQFLFEDGKLRAWYEAYERTYGEDPSGAAAFESLYAKSLEEVERDFRRWLDSVPEVPEEITPGMASLGVDIEPGTGEGPLITGVDRGSAASRAGLKRGDILTHVAGRSTRDFYELVRVLASCAPGQEVEVRVRRGRLHVPATIVLDAAR